MKKRKEVDISLPNTSQGLHIPDKLEAKVKTLLLASKPHPLGCHQPCIDDRKAMDAIFYRLRARYQ